MIWFWDDDLKQGLPTLTLQVIMLTSLQVYHYYHRPFNDTQQQNWYMIQQARSRFPATIHPSIIALDVFDCCSRYITNIHTSIPHHTISHLSPLNLPIHIPWFPQDLVALIMNDLLHSSIHPSLRYWCFLFPSPSPPLGFSLSLSSYIRRFYVDSEVHTYIVSPPSPSTLDFSTFSLSFFFHTHRPV